MILTALKHVILLCSLKKMKTTIDTKIYIVADVTVSKKFSINNYTYSSSKVVQLVNNMF